MSRMSILFILIILLISCQNLEHTNPVHPDFIAELNIDKTTQSIQNTAGSFSINVTSNINWTVSSSDPWLTYNPDSGSNSGTVTVSYTANTDTTERNATITINTTGGTSQKCTVKQIANNLTITPLIQTVSNEAGSFTIEVTSNINWTVSSSDTWLTYNPSYSTNNGTITVNYSSNTETTNRSGIITITGTITITGGVITQTCFISQEGIYGMIFISGGTFQMGSYDGDNDEKPVHSVTVSNFYMSKYEVTQKLYQEVMGTNPSVWTGANLPVDGVSWYAAVEFCNALSLKEGLTPVYSGSSWNQNANGYRLPTEAEWEYAAGSGSSNRTKWAGTNNESSLGDYAWYSSYGSKTVGTKQPNSLGLYDMSGNVWEWCWDWYGSYSSLSQINPTGPSSGSRRVLRGGKWADDATGCRVAVRYNLSPSAMYGSFGFRLVRNAP